MFHYYFVDSYVQFLSVMGQCYRWEAIGTTNLNINTDPSQVSEVMIKALFADHGEQDAFEANTFVHVIGSPFDNDELVDAHMTKLSAYHPFVFQVPTVAGDATVSGKGATPGVPTGSPSPNPAWCLAGQQLSRKPYLREMATNYVGAIFPSYRFRLFV